MKFQRTAKIFRSPINAVPLVNVGFLLLFFIMLSSLVYTPGISFRLDEKFNQPALFKKLSITHSGEVLFENKTYKIDEMEKLREELKALPADCVLDVTTADGAPKQLVSLLREQTKNLSVNSQWNNSSIELPTGSNLSGTDNPTVMVAINFGRQIFYENRMISTNQLSEKLQAAAQKSPAPLTLVLLADRSVENDMIMQLGILARNAGIHEMLLAARPSRNE